MTGIATGAYALMEGGGLVTHMRKYRRKIPGHAGSPYPMALVKSQGGGPASAPGAAKQAAGGGAGNGAPAPASPKDRDENMDVTPDSAAPNAPARDQRGSREQ